MILQKLCWKWHSLKQLSDEPEVIEPKLPIFNIPIKEFVDSYLFKLNFFMEQILKLNLEIINGEPLKNQKLSLGFLD